MTAHIDIAVSAAASIYTRRRKSLAFYAEFSPLNHGMLFRTH